MKAAVWWEVCVRKNTASSVEAWWALSFTVVMGSGTETVNTKMKMKNCWVSSFSKTSCVPRAEYTRKQNEMDKRKALSDGLAHRNLRAKMFFYSIYLPQPLILCSLSLWFRAKKLLFLFLKERHKNLALPAFSPPLEKTVPWCLEK